MDTALKQRLVGASVLIALAVVVLPMLLGGRPDNGTQETQKIELPAQPSELDFQTRKYPIGEPPAPQTENTGPATVKALPTPGAIVESDSQSGTAAVSAADPALSVQSDSSDVPASIDPVPVGQEQDVPAEKVVITPRPAPVEISGEDSGEPGRYIAQVASFGALENANRLAETLRGVGYSVSLDTIKSDVGTLHRVRVGPYGNEAAANQAVAQIQSQFKNIKPRVMDLQPNKSAQVTQPSDPLVRWVVQVGSFSDPGNADNLVGKLRLESMSAYKEEVNRSGSVIYRVRVGPFLAREDAIKANNQVAQRLSIDGVVMSSD